MMKEKKEHARLPWRHFERSPFCSDSVVLRGDGCAVIYGCRKILCYEAERICLSIAGRGVCVFGRELICTAFSAGSVTVEGRIEGVRYCESGCGGKCPRGEGEA